MKSITIKGSKRESVGKKATKALRDAGQVPCVLYGGNDKVVHFSAPELSFKSLIYTADVHTVKIDLGDKKFNAILQDIQFHPVTDAILHLDFYQFDDENPINMTLPVHTKGLARGVKNGGVLQINLRRMDLRGLINNLPDFVEVDITNLKIGDKLPVTAVASDKYEILHDDEQVICQVITPRNLANLQPDLDDEEEGGEESEEAPAQEGGENSEA